MPTVVSAEAGRDVSLESIIKLRLALAGLATHDPAELVAAAVGDGA